VEFTYGIERSGENEALPSFTNAIPPGVSPRLKILGAYVAANASAMRSNAPDSIARWSDKVFGNFALEFP
jgi:hypothetical protein